jgi:hypothetical protein
VVVARSADLEPTPAVSALMRMATRGAPDGDAADNETPEGTTDP